MTIQKLKINQLKEAAYNPRKKLEKTDEAYKRIKASIEEFGFVDPIIVNIKTMTVIGGHQRLEILKDLNHEEVECVILSLDEKQEKKLNLSLNK
ncbi:MAG: ParB N-terminal domain-containing protein, partial [Clostridia bacterium]|nr:ParB N-terminal domain-containing protein [Clostridia bacterium]